MRQWFDAAERRELLRANGLVVKPVTVTQKYSVYHDDLEYEDKEIDGVFFPDGREYQKPYYGYGDIHSNSWVDSAFDKLYKDKAERRQKEEIRRMLT